MKKKLLSNLLHRRADYSWCHYGQTTVEWEGMKEKKKRTIAAREPATETMGILKN